MLYYSILVFHFFIPHARNGHQPHLLRTKTTLWIIGAVLAAEALFLYSAFVVYPSPSSLFSLILPNVLTDDTNTARAAAQAPQLAINPLLVKAAQMKADDMAAKGYFAHTSPEGITPWYWIQKAGYRYRAAGENLAVNFIDSQDVHDAWMGSPSHRENILNGIYREIGIATATGMYQESEAVFVVQMFGAPIVRTAPPRAVVAQANAAEQIVSRPRSSMNTFLIIVIGIIGFAVVASVVVWMELRHHRLIANGVLVIVIAALLFGVNYYLATASLQIL